MSIHDVAKLSGVSPATVSKALNGYSSINEETRKRVQQAAKELGYFPNANARALSSKRNYLVGILFSDDLSIGLEHPFFSSIIEHFKKKMESNGYEVIFITSSIGNEKMSYLEHCRYRNVDGVYIATFSDADGHLKDLLKSDIKCVVTDMVFNENTPKITSNNEQGIQISVDYLASLGHQHIGFVGPYITNDIAKIRYNAYVNEMNKHQFKVLEQSSVNCPNFDFDSGYNAAKELVSRGKENLPTALCVASDIIAVGVINALLEEGISVPNDISIIGFDDIDVSRYITPKLTTIHQDRKKIGETVAEMLLASMEEKETVNETLVDVHLVERHSCSKPKY